MIIGKKKITVEKLRQPIDF